MGTPHRIYVAGAIDLTRLGITTVLDALDNVTLVGQTQSVCDAPLSAQTRRADVVIMAPEPGDFDAALSAIRAIKASRQLSAVMVIAEPDPAMVRLALAAGAMGFLPMTCTSGQLGDAVGAVAHGEPYLHPSIGVELAVSNSDRFDGLSDRGVAIARMVASGFTSREISAAMHISIRTVESHRSHIMNKLGLQRRCELVAWALERGLLQPGDVESTMADAGISQ